MCLNDKRDEIQRWWHTFDLKLKSSGISSKGAELVRTPIPPERFLYKTLLRDFLEQSPIPLHQKVFVQTLSFSPQSFVHAEILSLHLRHWNRLWVDGALCMPYGEVQGCCRCCCCCRRCQKGNSDVVVVVVDVLIYSSCGGQRWTQGHRRSWVCG